jgi:hypothetical protein
MHIIKLLHYDDYLRYNPGKVFLQIMIWDCKYILQNDSEKYHIRSHFNINSEFRFVILIFVSKVEEGSPFYIISTFNMSTYKLVYLQYSNDCILSFNFVFSNTIYNTLISLSPSL